MNTYPTLRSPNRQRIAEAVKVKNAINFAERILDPRNNIKKEDFATPAYGSAEYIIFHSLGLITKEEHLQYKKDDEKKHLQLINNSLKINHFKDDRIENMKAPKETGDYTPELSAVINRDKRLNDTCRQILNFLAGESHKWSRDARAIDVTKSFIAKGIGKSTSAVYRGLKRLQACGYISRLIIASAQTRMCDGLLIFLNNICFPKHRRKHRVSSDNKNKNGKKQGVAKMPQKYKKNILKKEKSAYITVEEWSMKVFNGLYRAKKKLLD